jgi:hypothetical protein
MAIRMVTAMTDAFNSMAKRPKNVLYGGLWFIGVVAALMAITIAFYAAIFSISPNAAAALSTGNGNVGNFLGTLILLYAIMILAMVLIQPLHITTTMLYAKGSLENKDIGFWDFLACAKEKYVRLLLATFLLAIVGVIAIVLFCVIFGVLGLAVNMIGGSSQILNGIMAVIAMAVLVIASFALLALTMIYIPYVFYKQKLDRGIIGSLKYSVGLAKANLWDIIILLLAAAALFIALILLFMVSGALLSAIAPPLAVLAMIAMWILEYAILYIISYSLLSLVKDAS